VGHPLLGELSDVRQVPAGRLHAAPGIEDSDAPAAAVSSQTMLGLQGGVVKRILLFKIKPKIYNYMYFGLANSSKIVLVLVTTLISMSYLTFEDEIPDFVGPRLYLSEPSQAVIYDYPKSVELQNALIKSNTTQVTINSIRGFPLPFYGTENFARLGNQSLGGVQLYERDYFLPFGFLVSLSFWNSIYSLIWFVWKNKKNILISHLR
jgi:hypothetical protein